MCGILFILSYDSDEAKGIEDSILPLLHHRGPDGHHKCSTTVTTETNKSATLQFHGTVLHLRGELTKQPLVSDEGHVFLWNGEIFGGDVCVPDDANDTSVLFEKLRTIPFAKEGYQLALLSLFETIQGPWAFVFYDAVNKNIWYGRDYFGRRSLMSRFKENTFVLSSLGRRVYAEPFSEVPAKALYCLNVKNLSQGDVTKSVETFPMQSFNMNTSKLLVKHRCLGVTVMNVNHTGMNTNHTGTNANHTGMNTNHTGMNTNHTGTDTNHTGTITNHTGMNTNHTGTDTNHTGTDTNHTVTNTNHTVTNANHTGTNANHTGTNASDLNNTVNGTDNHEKINLNDVNTKTICCNCETLNNSLCINGEANAFTNQENSKIKLSPSLCSNCNNSVEQCNDILSLENIRCEFLSVLEEAVRKRVYNLPRGHDDDDNEEASKVGILFSGGIDSAVLTSLADRCVPPHESIDLINVAFGQKQKVQQNVKKKFQKTIDESVTNFNVPDRVTGRTALRELSRKRKWNFIEVDVTLEELQEVRTSTITNLVYPLDSVLDDSIGCAIWFAARGTGRCYNLCEDGSLQLTQENYKCPVKVLLTGMGADEQLGGYARHRTKFESFGWSGLADEMKMELERISSRNLGRDDRCISDHGREARFPFLDENVISFLQCLPVCVKCDPRLPRGFGEKILLREVAALLCLPYASNLPKRAIQFGSKIAKLEGRKENGSDNCTRLENVQIS